MAPLQGVTVTILSRNKSTITDADGKYEITQLASGTYAIVSKKQVTKPKPSQTGK